LRSSSAAAAAGTDATDAAADDDVSGTTRPARGARRRPGAVAHTGVPSVGWKGSCHPLAAHPEAATLVVHAARAAAAPGGERAGRQRRPVAGLGGDAVCIWRQRLWRVRHSGSVLLRTAGAGRQQILG
jgi:hypothetical protein